MRNNQMVTYAAALAITALAVQSHAAIITGYSFGADASHLTLAATDTDASVVATAITPSSVSNVTVATINGSSYYGAGSTVMTVSRVVTNTANQYIYFTVTAASGYQLNLTSLTFNAAMGGTTGPRTVSIANSVDGLALASAVVATPALQARGTMTAYTYDYSGATYQGLSTITIRMYFDTPGVAQNIDIDTIQLNGSVSAIPEPASAAILSLIPLGLLVRTKRK